MRIHRIAIPAAFIAAIAALPLATARADYIPCSPFILSWPFCIADAVIDSVVTVPLPSLYLQNQSPFPPPYTGPAFPAAYAPPPGAR